MPALNLDTDAPRIAARLADSGTLLVACLCAQWCHVCAAYRQTFDKLADEYPQMCFVWIDIETHADQLDQIEVENFPTILIEEAFSTRFFGAVRPQPQIIRRMLARRNIWRASAHDPKLRARLAAPFRAKP